MVRLKSDATSEVVSAFRRAQGFAAGGPMIFAAYSSRPGPAWRLRAKREGEHLMRRRFIVSLAAVAAVWQLGEAPAYSHHSNVGFAVETVLTATGRQGMAVDQSAHVADHGRRRWQGRQGAVGDGRPGARRAAPRGMVEERPEGGRQDHRPLQPVEGWQQGRDDRSRHARRRQGAAQRASRRLEPEFTCVEDPNPGSGDRTALRGRRRPLDASSVSSLIPRAFSRGQAKPSVASTGIRILNTNELRVEWSAHMVNGRIVTTFLIAVVAVLPMWAAQRQSASPQSASPPDFSGVYRPINAFGRRLVAQPVDVPRRRRPRRASRCRRPTRTAPLSDGSQGRSADGAAADARVPGEVAGDEQSRASRARRSPTTPPNVCRPACRP